MWRYMEPATILLIEPDQTLGQVLSKVLARDGRAVLHATSAASAVRYFVCQPALLMLDQHLPDGTGVDVARLLRDRYPCLPMILMAACPYRLRDQPADTQYFRQVLQKPLELGLLRQAISAALNEVEHGIDNTLCAR